MHTQNELIPVIEKEDGDIAIGGRILHEFLGIKTEYRKWIVRMIEYGFEENVDFVRVTQKCPTPGGQQDQVNHFLTLDMAKEIAMIQRNEKGKQARQYFLAVEKAWNDPVLIMGRALELQKKKVAELKDINEQNMPKVIFADAVKASKTSILIGELAKLLKQNGVDIGQKRLFAWLRENGYLIKRKGSDYNTPTQKSMDKELFEIKETVVAHSDGHTSINKTSKVTGKGQVYFINKFLNAYKMERGQHDGLLH